MKIKLLNILAMVFTLCDCKGSMEPKFETDVKVTVEDESGMAVGEAEITLLFNHFDDKKSKKHIVQTDEKGVAKASDKVVASLLLKAEKQGFYPIRWDRVLIRMDVDHRRITNIEVPLVMRRVKSPASLFAKRFAAPIPVYDKPIGFDFEVGDWVAPFGGGRLTDIIFKFDASLVGYAGDKSYDELLESIENSHRINPSAKDTYFKGLETMFGNIDRSNYQEAINKKAGKWDGEMTIVFPNELEGIVNSEKDYCGYSRLTMPHMAYEGGYSQPLFMATDNYTAEKPLLGPGYFVRTRVSLDMDGMISSANYAKITSPINFDPRGRLEFTYVFNPTPNDRNLEFDTSKNRFSKLKFEERVLNP